MMQPWRLAALVVWALVIATVAGAVDAPRAGRGSTETAAAEVAQEAPAAPSAPAASTAAVTAQRGKLPLRFEANAGQWDERVRFVTRQGGATLFITDEGMTIGLRDVKRTESAPGAKPEEERAARDKALAEARTAAVKMKLVGVQKSAPRGEEELITKSNFFLGNDKTKWRTNVSNYAQVARQRMGAGRRRSVARQGRRPRVRSGDRAAGRRAQSGARGGSATR